MSMRISLVLKKTLPLLVVILAVVSIAEAIALVGLSRSMRGHLQSDSSPSLTLTSSHSKQNATKSTIPQSTWYRPFPPVLPYQSGTNWDPFGDIESLGREMDKLFAEMMNRLRALPGWEHGSVNFSPKMDMREDPDKYVLTFDLPGVDKGDINVRIVDRSVIVSGRRESSISHKGKNFLREERSFGQFARSVTLPGPVKASGMKAEYRNGVLTVVVPKAQASGAPRNIPVL